MKRIKVSCKLLLTMCWSKIDPSIFLAQISPHSSSLHHILNDYSPIAANLNPHPRPHHADTAIKVATSAGAIFGQVIFGYLADVMGRKKMYGIELMIIISTTLAQSLCGESKALSIVGVLIFCESRFFTGSITRLIH